MEAKYQTRITPNGDCIRACIASLFEVPILSVPDFTMIPNKPDAKPEDYPEWYLALQTYVRQFGFYFVEIVLSDRPWMPIPGRMLAIFMGPSAKGTKHAIVGELIDGRFVPVFDPMGEDQSTLQGVESVALLVPADPMYLIRAGKALEEIKLTTPGISNRIVADAIRDAAEDALGKNREYGGKELEITRIVTP